MSSITFISIWQEYSNNIQSLRYIPDYELLVHYVHNIICYSGVISGLYNIWCWWKKSTGTFFSI